MFTCGVRKCITIHLLFMAMSTEEGLSATFLDNKVLPRTAKPPIGPISYEFIYNQTNRLTVMEVTDFVCGRRGVCDKNVTIWNPLCTFECPPCHCDEMCQYHGVCCPDVLFEDSPDRPSSPSPYVACSSQKWTKWGKKTHILMVSRCPESKLDTLDIVTKCENPDINFQEEATPVTSPISQITYQNKFCAICHGHWLYRGWGHNVRCSNGKFLKGETSKENLWASVIKHDKICNIESYPPENATTRGCRPDAIDKCNVTGKWRKSDRLVETLCGLYTHRVRYYGFRSSYKSYKNIFCAVCNGASLQRTTLCVRHKPEKFPHPLSVLLDFNPSPVIQQRSMSKVERTVCVGDTVYDPLTMKCRPIVCPERRVMDDGQNCTIPFSSVNGLGFIIDAIIAHSEDIFQPDYADFSQTYADMMMEFLEELSPFVVSVLRLRYLKDNVTDVFENATDVILVHAEIVAVSRHSLSRMEAELRALMSREWNYTTEGTNITLSSSQLWCVNNSIYSTYQTVHLETLGKFPNRVPNIHRKDSFENVVFEEIGLDCPFLEYNLSTSNLTFNDQSNVITSEAGEIELKHTRFLQCQDSLKICLDELTHFRQVLVHSDVPDTPKNVESTESANMAMSIVSLVCISLSLVCLVLTLLTYGYLHKLRTLPGLNIMALSFHLFCAQLLFLIGINRTENPVACKVFGVIIYFSWMATFSWMSVSAFHINRVFTKIQPISTTITLRNRRFIKYYIFCTLAAVLLSAGTVSIYMLTSKGKEIGFGGKVCFLNKPVGIGAFFGGPLVVMLVANIYFFFRSVRSLKKASSISESLHKENKNRVFAYIKLSVLFGFTWFFGLFAAVLDTDVLWYTFIVLTGSQGVFLFLAFCVNRRVLGMIKEKFVREDTSVGNNSREEKIGASTTNSSISNAIKTE